ncbi:MAG: outer membrane beta-barrel protein, partial [Fidelibacterota bacterium]
TVGLFQKTFTDPIEIALISTPDLVYTTFQNAHSAYTYGLEVDLRYRLKFIPLPIGNGFLSMNGSYAESQVVTDSVVTLFNGTQYGNSATEVSRPLQGQSKATFNTSLYLHFKTKYSMSISYNTFSKRIHSVGVGVLGNEYEFPFQSLNVVSTAKIGPVKLTLKLKNLLNSRIRYGLIEKGTGAIKEKQAYRPGITSQLQITYEI